MALALNEAGTTKDVKYTWFFDQFGNVIGSVGLDRSSYAVLKDLTWVGTGKNGHAEATLITFDGSATEKTVTVNKIDGFDSATHYKWVEDQKGAVPYLRDNRGNGFEVAGSKAYAQVGEDDGSNTYYLGLALYSVETLDDDSVNLKGIDYVDAVEKATLNVKTGAIIYGANNSKVFVTDDTQFIVRTEDAKGNYKYEAFTGTDKLAKMADGTIDVMFSEKDSKNVVDYVYITEYTPAELNAHLLYTFETQYSVNEKENKYGMKVILDGKEETVYTHNEDIMKALSDGQNMLYKVTIDTNTAHDTYGEILSIDLINEATDGTIDSTDKVYVDYVTGGAELSGKRILVGYEAYTVNEDTKVVLADGTVGTIADLKAKDVETKGIWVVHDNKAAPTASCVYVGEKLGDEAAATVYVNGVAVKFEQAATPFSATVTGDLGAAAKVTAKADDKNAVVTIANGANSFDTNHSATVTVVSEDGTAKNVYTVTLAPKATVAAAITKVKGVDVTANGNDATQHPMYQVTLSTDLNSTYFTASDISYQGDNVKKVELVVLDKAGNIAMVDGAPQIATDKVAATEINNEYWICSLITLDSGEHYAAWIQIVEGL